MVDVGGYRVHLYCTGKGSPTVFVTAGFSLDWALVQPEVAKFARVCTYDASGTAWSDAGPGATCTVRVAEMLKLLDSAGISEPVVLVGYSLGAVRARMFAHDYPDRVAAMVIVDHAIDLGGLRPERRQEPKEGAPVLLSATPIATGLETDAAFARLPRRVRELHLWAQAKLDTVQTDDIVTACLEQSSEMHSLGKLPLVVVSNRLQLPIYTDLQTQLLGLSSNSRHIVAQKSGHGVIIDQPEVVVRAIRLAVQAARTRGHV